MRTPAGRVVTETGDLVAACLTVTMEAPLAVPGAAATFRTAAEIPEGGEERAHPLVLSAVDLPLQV